MSACEIAIVYKRADRTYRPGDVVEGDVRVVVREKIEPKSFSIVHGWRTHGAGNRDEGTHEETKLAVGEWTPGGNYSYPFRFTAPSSPLTYRGQLLNVEQVVTASADVAWKVDPEASEEYVLLPGPRTRAEYLAQPFDATEFAKEKPQKTTTGGKILMWILSPLLLVLLVMVLVLVLALSPILLTIALVQWVRKTAAERRLGKVSVEVRAPVIGDEKPSGPLGKLKRKKPSEIVRAITPGEPVVIAVRFHPQASFTIESVKATLTGTEICRSGSGTNSTTHTHVLAKEELSLAQGATYPAGFPVALSGSIPIPPTSAWSFKGHSNQAEWKLRFAVALPGWPDWVEEYKLALVPPEGAARP